MSYILEALKKSEQDRQRGKGPTLQTIHRPLANTQTSNKPLYFIIFLVLVAFFTGGAWWYENQSLVAVQAIPASNQNLNTLGEERQSGAKVETVMPIVAKEQDKPKSNTLTVLRFQDLPTNLRATIPGLSFSFHVYSDNPDRRTIIINGRRYAEEQWVEPELFLQEITVQGVVLVWQQRHAFSVDVVDGW